MKKFILSVLKVILIIIVFIAAAVGSYALVRYMGWPWWAGASVFGGVVGLVAAGFFLRRWLLRRRERKFVKRIVEQDDSAISAAPIHERTRLHELQTRWMEAIGLLRDSELRRKGNPLYVLPWYMIFGESDSGKSTAVASSRLTKILTDVGPVPGVSATRNCDWWFFEEAVILDTAGRYAIPIDESRDKEEWEKFLTLLVKFRKREPLNGLIVTLPADMLISGSEDELIKYGRSLRRRMNELMRVLGAKFPIYVLVTKMDLVFGMKGLTEVLPEEALSQAMGLINENIEGDPEDFVESAVASLVGRLRELRLLLIDKTSRFDPSFLIFSEELEHLCPRIKAFASGAFEDNPYQEQPMFRGMFFSSGEQTGELSSKFVDNMESMKGIERTQPGTRRGLFLHDFFSKVLPNDRNLFHPMMEFRKWRLITRNLGMAVWLLFLFFVCGVLSLSYIGNRRALDEMFTAFPTRPQFSNRTDEKLVGFDSFRDKIEALHEKNSNWWIPRMGLEVSSKAEDEIKDVFCRDFSKIVVKPMDEQFYKAISNLNSSSSEQLISDYIKFLVWRIDLLESRLDSTKEQHFAKAELPDGRAMSMSVSGFTPDLINFYGKSYVSYLEWTDDVTSLNDQKKLLQSKLGKLFGLKGVDFKWLVDWVNHSLTLEPVTLREFWGGPRLDYENEISVPKAFTTKGRDELAVFISELNGAVRDAADFKDREKAFWSWYADEYYKAWHNFASYFADGERQLLTKDDYRDMAARMATSDNPYFSLMVRMKDEFSPLRDIKEPPHWVQQLFDFNIVLTQYKALKSSGIEKSSQKAQDSMTKIVAELGGRMAEKIEDRIAMAKKLEVYMGVLDDVAAFTGNQESAFKSASALYPGSSGPTTAGDMGDSSAKSPAGAVKKNPIESATQALAALKVQLDMDSRDSRIIFDIVSGPLDFMVYVMTMDASCELQQLWEGQVLAETVHVPDNKLRERLFGKSGVVNKFVSGAAKPFLRRGVNGWSPRSWLGIPFPFRDDFLTFLSDGSQGSQQIEPEYTVTMSTMPTSVTGNATEEPYSTTLTVECGSGQQVLSNYNYAEKMEFNWKPDNCGTATLTIKFPSIVLSKSYEGKMGFPKFLSEFKDGIKDFTPEDFPDQQKALEGLGVKTVSVGYTFDGAVPLIKLLDIKPLNVPDIITECW